MLDLSLIIPIFMIIFFDDLFPYFFFTNYLYQLSLELNLNFKFIILSLFILLFCLKNFLLIIFSYFNLKFINLLCIRLSKDLFSLYLKQGYNFFLSSDSNNILRKVITDINCLTEALCFMVGVAEDNDYINGNETLTQIIVRLNKELK